MRDMYSASSRFKQRLLENDFSVYGRRGADTQKYSWGSSICGQYMHGMYSAGCEYIKGLQANYLGIGFAIGGIGVGRDLLLLHLRLLLLCHFAIALVVIVVAVLAMCFLVLLLFDVILCGCFFLFILLVVGCVG